MACSCWNDLDAVVNVMLFFRNVQISEGAGRVRAVPEWSRRTMCGNDGAAWLGVGESQRGQLVMIVSSVRLP